MSTFSKLRDKIEDAVAALFHFMLPIGQHVVEKTASDIAVAAMNGTVHGSDDMIAVAKQSLKGQLPELKTTITTAVAAAIVDHAHQAAVQAEDASLATPPAQ